MKRILTLVILLQACFLITAKTPPPLLQFNASAYSGCAPLTVNFYNSSNATGSYNWDFGDPASFPYNTSIDCSPTHTFQNAGTYTVTLTYPSIGTVTHVITVHPLPNPTINGDDTVCDGEIRVYTATGTAGSTFAWKVQGGTIIGPNNGTTVTVKWPTPGVGVVTVTETTIFGCSNSKTFKVLVANQPRLGNFCSDRKDSGHVPGNEKPEPQGCKCQWSKQTFKALMPDGFTVLSNALYTFQWTVTGGTIVSGQGTNTINVIVGAGPTFTVSLVVFNQFGCMDSSKCVFDVCLAPIASFKADTACLGGATNFDASASAANVGLYSWAFGDGTFGTTNSPLFSHTYAAAGTYFVKLTVRNADSCMDDTIIKVLVKPGTGPPIECIGTVCHNTKRCYTTPYFPGAVYTWVVTGGVDTVTSDTNICVTWGSGPRGTIKLTVTGGPYTCGSTTVVVPIFPDTVKIYGMDTVCTKSSYLYNTDLIPGSCYSWKLIPPFGSPVVIPPHTNAGNVVQLYFNNPGIYTLQLDMNNDLVCCSGHASKTIVVQNPIEIFGTFKLCEKSTSTYFSSVPSTWSVSNGTIIASNVNSCTVTWGNANYGTITATALNPALVCDNSSTYGVELVPKPKPIAIDGPSTICKGSNGVFSHMPAGPGITTTWQYTCGTLVGTPPPLTLKFNVVGFCTIRAIYTNAFGCSDTALHQIEVVDTAKPIILGPSQSCIGETKVYTIASNPGNLWVWNCIGGNILSSTNTSITIQWGNINQGIVSLQNSLCGGLVIKKVTIYAKPTGIITIGKGSCKGDTVRLKGPPGYTYLWNTAATTQSIIANAPNNSFSLIITNNGCKDTLYANLIPFPKLPKPNVNVSFNCMVAPSLPIPYQMTATYNAQWSYAWTPQTTTPASADTTYQHYSLVNGSTHTVVVTNQHGCKDTATITVSGLCYDTIPPCQNPPCPPPPPCTASATFVINYNPCTGGYSYTVTSGGPVSAPFWNFGDGFYSNLTSGTHWFTSLGNKTVTLSLWVVCRWITVTQVINIPHIIRPKMKHSFPFACQYGTVSLAYTPSSVVLGGGLTYSLDWGDGPPLITSPLTQSHTYTTAGTYIISYTITGPGCVRTIYDTVTIVPFKANFVFCDSGCVGKAVQFVDFSTSSVPIVHWNWTFGDATGSNLQNPFHIYGSATTFNPKLVITNQDGCKDSITKPIVITTFNAGTLTFRKNGIPIPPASVFQICEGDYLEAIAPIGPSWTYSWNNGPKTRIDTIRKSGIYWVLIGNLKGCIDTLGPFTVIVNPNPNATILLPDTACANTTIVLEALPGLGYTYNWQSLPALFLGNTNPTYMSASPGTYQIFLTDTNIFGCIARDTATIVVVPGPTAFITQNTYAPVCDGDSIQLTLNITGSSTSILWSTGATTLSIWVYQNGPYSAVITNANGCDFLAQATVFNINPRPDVSNVPKGCYKICKPMNAVVCGPYPKIGQILIYQWYRNNLPFSTNQDITITQPGCYYLWVKDSISQCISISPTFCVDTNGAAVAVIISNSPNPTLCKGSPGNILLQAGNVQPNVTYSWLLNNTFQASGTSYVATTPGLYALVAFFSKCCTDTAWIPIDSGDCCFDSMVPYTLIQDSTVYNVNTWWDGKYFVAGKVYIRGNAIFDLTEVDVVFDRDGEIIFEDQSIIRANNSVFRPCDMNNVWVGMTFKDSSWGLIHTSLYKNAEKAIRIESVEDFSVRITDNTFSNCNTGIWIRKKLKHYKEGITHNSFVIENTNFNTVPLYNTRDFFGIHTEFTLFDELLSQNDFRNSDRSAQLNRYFGIYMMGCGGNLSENTFTNMYRGIDIVRNNEVTWIENNEFEQTIQGKFPVEVQIRATDCPKPILMFANELRNSNPSFQLNTGIYANNCTLMNIRDNNIKGFNIGIWTKNMKSSLINENDIDLAGDIGILDSNSSAHTISCNIVRLKDYQAPQGNSGKSLGIYMQQGNSGNRIYANCIFDTREAIRIRTSSIGTLMPVIRNNYMYNFHHAGVLNINHSGSIGSTLSPGKNTFICNNYFGGGMDIISNVPISQGCNDGVTVSSLVVTTTICPGNKMYSSTAACGQVRVNNKWYILDQWDICDIYKGLSDIIVVDDWGKGDDHIKVVLPPPVQAPPPAEELIMAGEFFISKGDAANFTALMNIIRTYKWLDVDRIAILDARWTYVNVSRETGIATLNGMVSLKDQNNITLNLISWKLEAGLALSAGEIAILTNIDNAGNEYSAWARDLIHSNLREHDHLFGGYYVDPVAPHSSSNFENPWVRVVPNPATESVNVQYILPLADASQIELYDLHGKLITVEKTLQSEGSVRLNISNLAPGIYIVSVFDPADKKTWSTKLIKE